MWKWDVLSLSILYYIVHNSIDDKVQRKQTMEEHKEHKLHLHLDMLNK